MSEILEITSTKNTRIKRLLDLQSRSRSRRKEGLFVIEGILELERALKAGYKIEEVYFNRNMISDEQAEAYRAAKGTTVISNEVYSKIAYRQGSGGVIAIAKAKRHGLQDLTLSKNPLLLITEAVEKPGNIGALLRTADAAGADALIVCDPLTDIYNPNVIRSSIGGIFTVPVATGSSEAVIKYLKDNKINIYCTALTASKRYDTVDYSKGSAIVMGTEATGLSKSWLENSDQNVIIPMQGEMDSLNVSVSAAVVVFEAARQRDFTK